VQADRAAARRHTERRTVARTRLIFVEARVRS